MNWGVLLAYGFMILFWVISASASAKNKKKKAQRKNGAPQPVVSAKAERKRTGSSRASARASASRKAEEHPHEEIREGDDPCHPHTERFDDCGEHEGDDPCHPRMERAPLSNSPIEENMIGTEESAEEMRRLVLEGIVMSEVLKRPGERRR